MELDQYIKEHKQNIEKTMDFVSYLYLLMDKHGINKSSYLYNQALITKQTFSKIISGKEIPSVTTCVKFAFILKLDNHECKYLFKKAGYTLASSSTRNLIIRYCIENKIYDFDKLNQYLVKYHCKPII